MENFEKIQFHKTCEACPEQYDAFFENKLVGFLRLRHGVFRVECPDSGGAVVYTAKTKGDGCFSVDEREYHLYKAKLRIRKWIQENDLA